MVTYRRSFAVVLLAILSAWCFSKQDQEFDAKLNMLNRKSNLILASLCNRSGSNLYLPRFGSIWQQTRITRLDSEGKYVDFTWELSSFRMIRDSAKQKANFKMLQNDPKWNNGDRSDLNFLFKDHFADSVAQALSKKALSEGAGKIIGKNPRADYYFYLADIGYLKAGACVCDTIDLSDLNYFKGDFKIWFAYKAIRMPIKKNEGTEMYRYFETSIPEKLKGYTRWGGEMRSDTLDLHIK